MIDKLNIALIGCGYWGRNLARVIDENSLCRLHTIFDTNQGNLNRLSVNYCQSIATDNFERILTDNSIDACVIATPVSSHFDIVKTCLENGKHVLCEKVLSENIDEILYLQKLSSEKKLTLMVGHTFLYNSIVRYMKQMIENGDCGEIIYLTFKRTGLGPVRNDVDVVLDLATHDISILNYLLGEPEKTISTTRAVLNTTKADVAFIQSTFSNGIIANIQVSWLSPMKQRIIEVIGTKQMMIFDDVNNFEKLRIIKTGKDYHSMIKDFASFQLSVKDGDIIIPSIPYPEPLAEEFKDFANCIVNKAQPFSDVNSALAVARVLQSIKSNNIAD